MKTEAIKKMSGGSYEYGYITLKHIFAGRMYDRELDDLITDLVPVLHDLEWWQSSDISEDEYRATVNAFKQKWFGTNRETRLKEYIDETVERAKKECYDMVGTVMVGDDRTTFCV